MNEKISVQFLGGCSEVGKLGMILDMDGLRLLFDYGISPTKPPSYPMEAPSVDLTLLTHAHLDHSGMIPWLASRQDCFIWSTDVTREISLILHNDSLKIAKTEGYAYPYSKADIKEVHSRFVSVDSSQIKDIGGTELHIHSAGHIPGSLMFELRGSRTILFTGDINTINTRLMWGTHPVKCDVLFIEGTYSGRNHPNRVELEKLFLDTIDDVVKRGGVAVVPAFAVARSQELALVLSNAGYDVWMDGMGNKVSKIFLKYPDSVRSVKKLRKALNKIKTVHSSHGRKLALKGEVILTTSGMLDGGPVLAYLEKLRSDPKSAVLLTGYQVEGTNGRQLLDKGTINFYGVNQRIECEVHYFDFSAHAGHDELVNFAKACSPEKIVIFHSDDRAPLANDLRDIAEVYTPENGEVLTL
ncbi:MAG TPA: MBL fold metallo-hydrolase [Thermoplasmatales archaeon]|nr:MBL fold metallo-hydrolase [Thermoplasmatales archaeon]